MDKQFRCDECSRVIGTVEEDAEIMSFDPNVGIVLKCKDCKENNKQLRDDYDEFGNIIYKFKGDNELLIRD